MRIRNLPLLIIALAMTTIIKAKEVKITSPNGEIAISLTDRNGRLSYTASLEGKDIFSQDAIEMKLSDKTLGQDTRIKGFTTKRISEELRPAVPIKQAAIRNDYTEATITLKGNYKMVFRVFDNAVAYRFILNERDSVFVIDENICIRPAVEMNVHYQGTGGWGTASESPYTNCRLTDWKADQNMAVLPVGLSSTKGDLQLLISESDLRDYPGLYLRGNGDKGCITGQLVPYYKEWEVAGDRGTHVKELAKYAARTSGRRSFPWRYIAITDSRGLIEQTLTAQLAGACELKDVSWIKPGQVSWDWWNHKSIYGPDVKFKPGCNTDTYKYYIDFASKYGIKYIIMDEGWAKGTYEPFTPNPNLDLHECIRYGKEKGVGIILWLTWTCVERNLDTLFATYEKWGVAGTKIDFMDRQDQWMINWYERTIKEAAKHHIIVDFHGAMKPAGLEHRYPNLLAYEGVLGLEQMGGCRPDNTLYIPFLRNAVGAVDFTPGAMINTQPEYDKWSNPNCSAIGTRAYSMALFTIMETGTQMLADSPTQYYKNPDCTNFLTQIPVTWDETRALEASIGEYLIVAKRNGKKWFVAGICNGKEQERSFNLPLDFLSGGSHKMTLVSDGFNAGWQAMDYVIETKNVDKSSTLNIKMVRNGGFSAIIE